MTTHIWHAKRFRMASLFGWQVPLIHSNRGAQAAMRLSQSKPVLQDVTWMSQPMWMPLPSSLDLIQSILPEFLECKAQCWGETVLHKPNQFPQGAIGPVRWLVAPSLLDEASDALNLYIFSHPFVQQAVFQCLSHIAQGSQMFFGYAGGLACLRLRGTDTMDSLQAALESLSRSEKNLSANCSAEGKATRLSYSDCGVEGGLLLLRQKHHSTLPDLSCNKGVSGLDVFCKASVAKSLFLTLVLQGGACPIGIAEEAALALEAEPPVPMFPRDYPDTSAGRVYWNGSSDEWNIVRTHWEGGNGRISAKEQPVEDVAWADLAGATSNMSVVCLRGAFGEPLIEAMTSATYLPEQSTEAGAKNHCPAGPNDGIYQAPQLSKEDSTRHVDFCNTMIKSLSLPTVVLCHLTIAGKGTARPGTQLVAWGSFAPEKDVCIGVVSCGSFSPFRGYFHGFAICGVSHLLQCLAESQLRRGLVIARNHKKRAVRMLVSVGCERARGTLSLQL
jgi:ribonuclease P/MRP protein subunit POP1